MDYVSLSSDSQSGSGSTDTQISGTVSGSNVNVRSGAGTGYSIVGRKNSGDVITVYERKTSGGLNWGRIGDNQWICLAYVRLENAGGTETPQPGSESNSSVSGDGTSAVQDTGTVSSTTGLNGFQLHCFECPFRPRYGLRQNQNPESRHSGLSL